MNYLQTIEYLFSQLPMYQRIGKAAYKANLDNTLALDKHFNHPHRNFKCIHVAGTNGKGSVSHMLAAVLQAAGYKTGLYTSPHLRDFRERIRVNGHMIPEQYVIDFVAENKSLFEEVKPSFFEMTVALAFEFFKDIKVDVAVIETGMGGRLDSTNIVTPLLSIITNIGLDHTEFLGTTPELIATEKAGIIKPGIPVLIGESQATTKPVFIEKAGEKKSPVFFADEEYTVEYSTMLMNGNQNFQVRKKGTLVFGNLECDLKGFYQKKNVVTLLAASDLLKEHFQITRNHIYEGLKNVSNSTGLKGRWQVLQANPLVIADSGHNTDGIKAVMEQIHATPHMNLHMVLGFVNDKNIDSILDLLPRNATYYFTRASIPRAMDEKALQKLAAEKSLRGESYPTVEEALKTAVGKAGANDLVFVGGSTFVVAEVV
jgi:dihydrofolate synthase / folylpolyglutamate synthase